MRLRWVRGRIEDREHEAESPPLLMAVVPSEAEQDAHRAREWLGCNDAGEPIARVVRVQGPFYRASIWAGWRLCHAVALDSEARIVELRPRSPAGEPWLVVVRNQVVGRAALPLQAVRRAEALLSKA